jgi:hypothetical protein
LGVGAYNENIGKKKDMERGKGKVGSGEWKGGRGEGGVERKKTFLMGVNTEECKKGGLIFVS